MDKTDANRVFISDLGENQTTEIDGVKTEIGRFAVWAPVPKGNHNVVEVGSDVVALMHKYDVPGRTGSASVDERRLSWLRSDWPI